MYSGVGDKKHLKGLGWGVDTPVTEVVSWGMVSEGIWESEYLQRFSELSEKL